MQICFMYTRITLFLLREVLMGTPIENTVSTVARFSLMFLVELGAVGFQPLSA